MHYRLENNDLVRWLQLSKFLSMSSPKCNSTTTWVQPITNNFSVFKSLLIWPWRDLKNYIYLRKIFTNNNETIAIREKKSMCSSYVNLFKALICVVAITNITTTTITYWRVTETTKKILRKSQKYNSVYRTFEQLRFQYKRKIISVTQHSIMN